MATIDPMDLPPAPPDEVRHYEFKSFSLTVRLNGYSAKLRDGVRAELVLERRKPWTEEQSDRISVLDRAIDHIVWDQERFEFEDKH